MKKIISIVSAVAIAASSMLTACAAETNTGTTTDELLSMSDTEKQEFIDTNLDTKLQHLSTLATLSSDGLYDEIADEVKASVDNGVTAVEIKEAIYHSGAYAGYTRAAKALDAADIALSELGEDVTYSSRITSSEDTRYSDGLATQRFLFGQQIGTITDDMEPSQKLQTLYLSGICFGDFYNRVGLSLYTHEFLTLCTIAGNGNCASQLSGHVSGNLNVGHSKDMLRAAMLLNEKYNGEEKTRLALDAINSAEGDAAEDPAAEPAQPTNTIATDYTSDSEELLGIAEHFKTDDKDGYIDKNIDSTTQAILENATTAVIDGTEIPTSSDKATQILIDLAVMDAQGGRESEVPAKVAEGKAAGLTNDNMLAVPLLTVQYNGFPRTLNMRGAIASALENTDTTSDTIIVTMQIGNPIMTVNGTEQNIDENGTVPIVTDDRTLLPIRAFVEGIGGEVSWNDDTQTATLTYNGDVIRLIIDSNTAYLNDTAQELDVTPVIINDRTMLPIRFIAESFGFDVAWDEPTQTVTITGSAVIPASTATATTTATPTPTAEPNDASESGKTLVAYYSATGTTENVAKLIAEQTGGTLFEIVPTEPYTDDDLDYNDDDSRVTKEHDDESLRDVELTVTTPENWSDYDTVYIGYPIWWGIAAWPVNNFVKDNDFTGKTVIPFCTSASSGLGQSGKLLEEMAGTGNWLEGQRFRSSTSADDVKEWIDSMN